MRHCAKVMFRIFVWFPGAVLLAALATPASAQVLTSSDLSRLRSVGGVALSPDSRYIAYTIIVRDRPGRPYGQVWVMDLSTEKSVRLGGDKPAGGPLWSADSKWIAFHGADGDQGGLLIAHPDGSETTFLAVMGGSNSPLPGTGKDVTWSPDGKQVAYRNTQGKTTGLYIRASDGSGKERQIGDRSDGVITVEDWSPDGKYLAITHVKLRGASNWHDTLQVLRVAGEGKLEFEIDNVADGKFSPDGRWLTYHDDASGQVYVTAFPGPGARIAVSSSGGDEPRWRGDGQELFYVDDDQNLISVQVHESPTELHVLSSHRLFRIPLPNNAGFYDVTRDGKRFLVTIRTHKEQAAPLTVVTNWSAQFQDESKR